MWKYKKYYDHFISSTAHFITFKTVVSLHVELCVWHKMSCDSEREKLSCNLQARKITNTAEGGIWIHACKYTHSVVWVIFVKQCEVEGFNTAN